MYTHTHTQNEVHHEQLHTITVRSTAFSVCSRKASRHVFAGSATQRRSNIFGDVRYRIHVEDSTLARDSIVLVGTLRSRGTIVSTVSVSRFASAARCDVPVIFCKKNRFLVIYIAMGGEKYVPLPPPTLLLSNHVISCLKTAAKSSRFRRNRRRL